MSKKYITNRSEVPPQYTGGNGNQAAYTPGRTDDYTLRSIEYVKVLDAICEGEVEGLVDGLKSVYLNGTPVQNADTIDEGGNVVDGSFNFEEVKAAFRNGTVDQQSIPGFPSQETEKTVQNPEVKFDTPVTFTTSNNITSVRLNMRIPRLSYTNPNNGNVLGTTVEYRIELESQDNPGVFYEQPVGYSYSPLSVTGTTQFTTNLCMGFEGNVKFTTPDLGTDSNDDYYNTWVKFTVEYKANADSTWIKIKDYNLNVAADGGVVTNGTKFIVVDLPEDNYDVRITNITYGDAGGSLGFSVAYEWIEGYDVKIQGKSTSVYTKSHMVDLTQPGLDTGPWQIRITRLTADSTSDYLQNKTFLDSYTEIVDYKLSYPMTALVGLAIDSTEFSSVPQRGYDMKLLKVKVPSNYDPISRVYTGIWDGTFKAEKEWTDNPAWCFYDLVTNDRYGLGKYVSESLVDKSTLYTIAQYCDELVSSGQGFVEPRFTCNIYIQTREEAYKVLQDFVSIFRGMMLWAGNTILTMQDSPSPVVAQFTNADVIDGLFNYEGSSTKARHTVALVTWNDPNNGYKQTIEYVEDSEAIALYGIKETEVVAIGCTSRGQAARVGKWLLYVERYETETVTFKTGLEGTQIMPGDIIKTSDQFRVGARYGGRITGSTSSTVSLDSPLTIPSGESFTITNVLKDGTLVDSTITNGAGTYSTVNISPSFTEQPLDYSLWVVTSNSVSPEEWRVVGISEEEKAIYTVTALKYNSSKYNYIEQGWKLEQKQSSLITLTQDHVTNITTEDSLYLLNDNTLATKLEVSWDAPKRAVKYVIKYTLGEGNPVSVEVQVPSYEILNVPPGSYTITVTAYNSLGIASKPVTINGTTLGVTVTPDSVSNFTIIVNGLTSFLSWDAATAPNVAHYELRFSPDTVGATWEDSTLLVQKVNRDTTTATVPTLVGTYFIKTVSISGTYAPTATSLVQLTTPTTDPDNPESGGYNLVATFSEDPTFPGVVDGKKMYVVGDTTNSIYEYTLTTEEEVNTASITNSFSVSSQTTSPREVCFRPDGLRMYVLSTNAYVYQYDLGSAWDISTAVYNSANYYANTEVTLAEGLVFSPDGTNMYILDWNDDEVVRYNLGTAWDVTSASFTSGHVFNVGTQEATPQAITFNPNGSQMFVVGDTADTVFAYDLSTPWDIRSSSCTYSGDSFSVNLQEATPQGLTFSTDGTQMYVAGPTSNDVFMYDVPTPWDITSITGWTSGDNFDITTQDTALRGVRFSEPFVKRDGSTLKLTLPGVLSTGEYKFFNTVDLGGVINAQFIIDLDITASTISSFMADWTTLGAVTVLSGTIVDPNLVSVNLKIRYTDDDPAGTPTWSAWEPFVVGDYKHRAFEFKAVLVTLDPNITPLIVGLDVSISLLDRIAAQKDIVTKAGDRFKVLQSNPSSVAFSSDGSKMYIVDPIVDTLTMYTLSNPWQVASAEYTNELNLLAAPVANGVTYPLSIRFNRNGKRLFILSSTGGDGSDRVYMYDLSVAWDITASSISFTPGDSFYLGSQGAEPSSIAFSNDGHYMFTAETQTDSAYMYYMSTAWDVTTASYTPGDTFDLSSQDTNPAGIGFNFYGTKMYILGNQNEDIFEYTLTSPFDITPASCSYSGNSYDITYDDNLPYDIFVPKNGEFIYVMGNRNDTVYRYEMTTPYNFTTLEYNGKIRYYKTYNASLARQVTGVRFSPDGLIMYVTDDFNNRVVMYDLATAWDATSASFTTGDFFSVSGQTASPQGLAFSSDGSKMYVASADGPELYMYTVPTPWDITSITGWTAGDLLNCTSEIGVTGDVMDISFNSTGTKLYISDLDTSIYEYDLSTAWDIKSSSASHTAGDVLDFTNEITTCMGLTFSPDGSRIFLSSTGGQNPYIVSYLLEVPWDIKTGYFEAVINVGTEISPHCVEFNNDGTKMYCGNWPGMVVEFLLSTPYNILTATATGSFINYPVPFTEIPSIAISGQDLKEGDYYEISEKTNTGFHIVFKNIQRNPVKRTFDYIAKGY